MDAWRTLKLVLRAHPPDQHAQFHLDSRAPSPRVWFPTPMATKAGSVPTHQRFGLDNCDDLQNRRKPSIHLNEEPAIIVREPDATMQPTPQDNQLMSKHRVLSFKPQLRLPGRPERNRTARSFRQLRRFHHVINSDKVFGTHNRISLSEQIRASMGELHRDVRFMPDQPSVADRPRANEAFFFYLCVPTAWILADVDRRGPRIRAKLFRNGLL